MPTPDVAQVKQAIEVFLKVAYPAQIPARVQNQIGALSPDPEQYLANAFFVPDPPTGTPKHYRARLGNHFYPHMKMSIDLAPDGNQYLFRVDTHDRHCCPPPENKEYPMFCELMSRNQTLATQIESAWEQAGVPTFKTYLKQDLERRKQLKASAQT